MKKVLFIVLALLVVGCSKNNPVAPVQNIYNSSGDLYRVEFKNKPLVFDSVGLYSFDRDIISIYAHVDFYLPADLVPDSTWAIILPSNSSIEISDNISSRVIFYIDSLRTISMSSTFILIDNYIRCNLYIEASHPLDSITIMTSGQQLFNNAWFTFIAKKPTILQ